MDTSSSIIRAGGKTAKPVVVRPVYRPELVRGLNLTGFEDEDTANILTARHLMERAKLSSLRPLLPLLLNIKGNPYTLDYSVDKKGMARGYFPFEPFFRTRMPRKTLLKTGRQVSKSTSLAARGIVHSNCVPWFSTLYITPLFEMVRRFSQNYVRPFIDTSPARSLFVNSKTIDSVLQKSFANRSQMLFTFACLSADRTRGVSADKNSYDEVQDMDKSFIPIIRETMSGSTYKGIEEFAGTPKSLENCIEGLWRDSSQAEWVIKCLRCGHWNVPAMTHDLDRMVGPLHDSISAANPGVVCGKCQRPKTIFPHLGRWVHARPERRWQFAGYHVPQVIMPMHYGDPEKWSTLLQKRAGRGNTPLNVYYNEVQGESYDVGSRIITMTELQRAARLPWERLIDQATPHIHEYTHRVLAADWGGGGEDEVSYTCLAVLGMRPDGSIDVIWGHRSLTPHDHVREARLCIAAIQRFQCHVFAHDYTGAGRSARRSSTRPGGRPTGSSTSPTSGPRPAPGS
jgi:hypothetical protein